MNQRRIDHWAEGKDLAAMLGSLSDFSNEFNVFSPLSDDLVEVLRRRPAALRKAFRSACHELHPDMVESLPPEAQEIALALMQKLVVAGAGEDFEDVDGS